MASCVDCGLPLRSNFFTTPCGHALHQECAESLLVGVHRLTCPECEATCARSELWTTFWSMPSGDEADCSSVHGRHDCRLRRMCRLQAQLQHAQESCAASAEVLEESRASTEGLSKLEAEIKQQVSDVRSQCNASKGRAAKLGAAASAASCFAAMEQPGSADDEQPADALIRALQRQHAGGSLSQLFAVMQQLESMFAKQYANSLGELRQLQRQSRERSTVRRPRTAEEEAARQAACAAVARARAQLPAAPASVSAPRPTSAPTPDAAAPAAALQPHLRPASAHGFAPPAKAPRTAGSFRSASFRATAGAALYQRPTTARAAPVQPAPAPPPPPPPPPPAPTPAPLPAPPRQSTLSFPPKADAEPTPSVVGSGQHESAGAEAIRPLAPLAPRRTNSSGSAGGSKKTANKKARLEPARQALDMRSFFSTNSV